MAFIEKYYIEHTSPAGVGFRVSIKKDGFSGDTRRLYLEYNGLQIDHKHDDWFEPIIGQSSEFPALKLALIDSSEGNHLPLV